MKTIENHSLYHYDSCPFCYKVRAAMSQLGIEMELRNIYQGAEHLSALKEGGGSTMVPCLRIDKDGSSEWMYESSDIVDYLKKEFGE